MNNNIEQSKLDNIAAQTGEVIDLVNDGVKWYTAHKPNNEAQIDELKKYRRKLKKVKKSVTEKPVIALFGASQVGKSYLVRNIFNDETNTFNITDYTSAEKKSYNFIQNINPEGKGSEATSVVTRFTYDKDNANYPLPVKIRMLRASAIVTIIIDTYLSDIGLGRKNITTEEVEKHIEEIQKLTSNNTQYFFDEDDVFYIYDYIEELFGKGNHTSRVTTFKDANFWKSVAKIIHKIEPNNWGKTFEILWGNKKELTQLFNILIDNLNKINFSEIIYAEMDAVLRENGTILDVERLEHILSEPGDSLNVKNNNNENLYIPRNFLCALSHEVILNISETSLKKHDFIKEVDMLDFPGARSRAEYDERQDLDDEKLSYMFRRGKVSYLFNSYSVNYEINNLFVCTKDEQKEVTEIPRLIDMWINYNVGENIDERTSTLESIGRSPLFIIFTFWNNQLKFDQNSDKKDGKYAENLLNGKWELRFKKLLNGDIFGNGVYQWNENWIKGKNFQNYYLLRDYTYSNDIFFGFEQDKTENGILKERQEYYEVLEKSFKNSPLTKKLFPDVNKAWAESSIPNKDGSQHIIDNMKLVANNITKTKRFIDILNDERTKLEDTLTKHYHSDKADKNINDAINKGNRFEAYMNTIFGRDAHNFGYFIQNLTISEHEILTFYNEILKESKITKNQDLSKFILWRNQYDFLTPKSNEASEIEKNYIDNLEIIRKKLGYKDIEETKTAMYEKFGFKEKNDNDEDELKLLFNPTKLYKETSFTLAEAAQNFWFDKNLNSANAEELKKLGFAEDDLEDLFANLQTIYKKFDITSIIARKIRDYVDGDKRIDEAESMIAHITVGVINEFVTSVGWSYYPAETRKEIRELNQNTENLELQIPQDDQVHETLNKKDILNLFEFMENLTDNLNKIPLDKEQVSRVPMIKNYSRWCNLLKILFLATCNIPTYDVEANRQLGEIIDKVKTYNF